MDIALSTRPARPAGHGKPASKAVWLVATAAFALELAVSARYGYDRDELYFLAAGRHLAWDYVDQPALTPLLARLDAMLTGNTLVGLRALPALGFAAMVIVTARMARLLGAGRRRYRRHPGHPAPAARPLPGDRQPAAGRARRA